MTLEAVKERWPVYRGLLNVMFGALNGQIELDDPARSPVRPFPVDAPDDWGTWTSAALFHINVAHEFEITDAAFRNVADMLTASEIVAAKVVVAEPTADDIDKVEKALAQINKAVKADQRFHAALAIGVAVAGEIEKNRKA